MHSGLAGRTAAAVADDVPRAIYDGLPGPRRALQLHPRSLHIPKTGYRKEHNLFLWQLH